MNPEFIVVRQVDGSEDPKMPTRKYSTDAGIDLFASHTVIVPSSGLPVKAHIGYSVEIPVGWMGLICARSGLSSKHGVIVCGDVIDAGYRGELIVLLRAIAGTPCRIPKHNVVAQLVVLPCGLH